MSTEEKYLRYIGGVSGSLVRLFIFLSAMSYAAYAMYHVFFVFSPNFALKLLPFWFEVVGSVIYLIFAVIITFALLYGMFNKRD